MLTAASATTDPQPSSQHDLAPSHTRQKSEHPMRDHPACNRPEGKVALLSGAARGTGASVVRDGILMRYALYGARGARGARQDPAAATRTPRCLPPRAGPASRPSGWPVNPAVVRRPPRHRGRRGHRVPGGQVLGTRCRRRCRRGRAHPTAPGPAHRPAGHAAQHADIPTGERPGHCRATARPRVCSAALATRRPCPAGWSSRLKIISAGLGCEPLQ